MFYTDHLKGGPAWFKISANAEIGICAIFYRQVQPHNIQHCGALTMIILIFTVKTHTGIVCFLAIYGWALYNK